MKKQTYFLTATLAFLALNQNAVARPEFIGMTGARGCTDCHSDNNGNGYKSGVLNAYFSGGINGLKTYIQSLSTASADTAPVMSPIDTQWDINVGETPLVIPLSVYDKEGDTFTLLKGTIPSGYSSLTPTGYTLSSLYINSSTKLPTIDFKWSPTSSQANQNYTLSVYAKENAAGHSLYSKPVVANIRVWPARTTATKNVSQFAIKTARWSANTLTMTGYIYFKSTVSSTQKLASLNSLTLNLKSNNGIVIGSPVKLTIDSKGMWTKTMTLTSTQVPCLIKSSYEGLNSSRAVQYAPTTCVK